MRYLKMNYMRAFFAFIILVSAIMLAPSAPVAKAAGTFTNPLNGSGADPWMTYYNGNYYLAATTWGGPDTGLTMRKSPTIDGLKSAPQQRIFTDFTASRCCNVWAPSFELLSGPNGTRWYFYYSAGPATCCDGQRIHVAESAGTDPTGPYTYRGQLTDSIGGWMIDQSILRLNGQIYLLFSAWSGNLQNIYIAPMSNPWTVNGNRVLLSSPTLNWERVGGNVNEGPVALQRNGKTFIIFSASFCSTPDYKLGMLTYTGTNPLQTSSWTKRTTPVFQQGNGVYGPAHNGFFKSPDGTEDWMVYHGNSSTGGGCDMNRTTRVQKVNWNADGTPNFGTPAASGASLAAPSGEASVASPPTYTIRNRNSGKCLDVQSPNFADNANVGQWTCNGGLWQRWAKRDLGGGYSQFVNLHSGKVLDVSACSTADGGNIAQFSWLNNNCQQWQSITTTAPYFRLVNRQSGKVMDVASCSTADGADVRQWTWLNNNCQQWQLVP
jgi:GH43 family beta-xylosidase